MRDIKVTSNECFAQVKYTQKHHTIWYEYNSYVVKYEHDTPTRSWLVVLYKDSFEYSARIHTFNSYTLKHTKEQRNARPCVCVCVFVWSQLLLKNTHTHKQTLIHLLTALLFITITCLQTQTQNRICVLGLCGFERQLKIESTEQIILSMWQYIYVYACACACESIWIGFSIMNVQTAQIQEQMDCCTEEQFYKVTIIHKLNNNVREILLLINTHTQTPNGSAYTCMRICAHEWYGPRVGFSLLMLIIA